MTCSQIARIGIVIVALEMFAVSLWCLGVGQFFFGSYLGDWANRCAFDSQKWIGAEGSVLRNDMVDDLDANYPLLGKTEAEVTLILGQPTEKATGDKYPNAGCDQVWEYQMVLSRHTIGPDADMFLVGFCDGKVNMTSQRGG